MYTRLFVLRLYGPVNPMGSFWAWSVYLTTCLPCKPQFYYIKVGFKGGQNYIGMFSWWFSPFIKAPDKIFLFQTEMTDIFLISVQKKKCIVLVLFRSKSNIYWTMKNESVFWSLFFFLCYLDLGWIFSVFQQLASALPTGPSLLLDTTEQQDLQS